MSSTVEVPVKDLLVVGLSNVFLLYVVAGLLGVKGSTGVKVALAAMAIQTTGMGGEGLQAIAGMVNMPGNKVLEYVGNRTLSLPAPVASVPAVEEINPATGEPKKSKG